MPVVANLSFCGAWALAGLLMCSTAMAQHDPGLEYTVQAKDQLMTLSRQVLKRPGDWNEVARLNRLKDPNRLTPGQKLIIPVRLMKSTPAPARLVSVHGGVQVDSVAVKEGMDIPEGTTLQTGSNSSAVMALADGSRVQLLPNSLATLASSQHYALRDASASGSTTWFSGLIRLAQGALDTLASKTTRRASPLQIETPTSLVGVRGTRFRVAFDATQPPAARAEVLEGLVRADHRQYSSGADLPAATGTVIHPADRNVMVMPLLPAPDLDGAATLVDLPAGEWRVPVLPGAAAYRLQASKDSSFERIALDLKAPAGNHLSLAGLPEGPWYIRVRGIADNGLEGLDGVKPLTVRLAVKVSAPVPWRVVHSSLSLVEGATLLQWSPVSHDGAPLLASSYRISLRPVGGSTWIDAASSTQTVSVGQLQPGRYDIRLEATLANGNTLGSENCQLEVPDNWGSSVVSAMSVLRPLTTP